MDRPWNHKFLGFSFLRDKKATIRLAPQSISRFKEKVRELMNRTRSMLLESRITRLICYLIGWIGYFRLAAAKGHYERFDQWIRRRLRMCLWKQWKRVRTRIRELRALGVPEYCVSHLSHTLVLAPFFGQEITGELSKEKIVCDG
ncbi:hypothetical protein GCM10010911_68900 [Paenibacillus nasutitermitis]|uniref:Group II intron maturase-specific domain-containing protein n=1 Tax=Paenibacillus nasutitermitis TaxID=1652958 RepID=A0A916ZK35_9BACL|nr:hypothetical protein GCM10010911_68900 [Paenibacillus nasutitermitis]